MVILATKNGNIAYYMYIQNFLLGFFFLFLYLPVRSHQSFQFWMKLCKHIKTSLNNDPKTQIFLLCPYFQFCSQTYLHVMKNMSPMMMLVSSFNINVFHKPILSWDLSTVETHSQICDNIGSNRLDNLSLVINLTLICGSLVHCS